MRATICSDQISGDLNTALEVLHEFNCREFELRQLGFDGALDADERWLECAEKAVRVKRIHVTQIATDFFGQPLESGGAPGAERVKKLFALAHRMSCSRVTIFGCHEADAVKESETDSEEHEAAGATPSFLPGEEGLDVLAAFCELAEVEKIEVLVRTKQGTCAGNARDAVALIKELEQPNLGLDWDVAESFSAGDGSGLDEIDDVLPVLKAVHFRDAVRRGMSAEWASMGKGVIPWEEILERLQTEKFKGPVIADPCVSPKLKESRQALTLLTRWIDAAKFKKRGADEDDEFALKRHFYRDR